MKHYDLYKHNPVYTIKELLGFCAEEYGEKEAFAYQSRKQDVIISFSEFHNQVNAFGSYLFDRGFKECHVAVLGENSYEWILTHFAVTCGGNVIVPVDKELDSDNIAELLSDSASSVLVYSDTYDDIIEGVRKKLVHIGFINMDEIQKCIARGKFLIATGYREFVDFKVDKDDLASIVYTSGTTGKSKGVMLTHNNFMSNLYAASCNVKIEGSSILLLPLHHTFGLVAGLYAVMYYGCMLYINKSLRNILTDFKNVKPQNLFVVPMIVETLYKNIWTTARKQNKEKLLKFILRLSDFLLKCGIDVRRKLFAPVLEAFGGELEVIICGGAPLNSDLVKAFKSFGIMLLNGYGITECAPIVAVNRNEFNIVGSVGLPLICNEVKIAEDGEILVRGDNVMQGYYNNPVENEKVFDGKWFKTGDIGTMDEHGTLYITGRIKNLIILSNGENIPAELIEQRVDTIAYVKEVIAYGRKDVITVEVYLDEEVDNAREEIYKDIEKLNKNLPFTQNIGNIVIRDTEFPKTTTKKIKRNYMEV